MIARFPGVCARTGAPIKVGDAIEYDRRTRRASLKRAAKPAAPGPDFSVRVFRVDAAPTDVTIPRASARALMSGDCWSITWREAQTRATIAHLKAAGVDFCALQIGD